MREALSIAIIITALVVVPVWCDEQASSGLQRGEPVLAVKKATVDAPLRRAAGQPYIELSNFRRVQLTDGKQLLQVDYRILEGTVDLASVVFKTIEGRKLTMWPRGLTDKSSTLQLPSLFAKLPDNIELWIECGGSGRAPTETAVGFKISNSVGIGDFGQFTYSRELKSDELVEHEKSLKPKEPPKPLTPPAGYVLSDQASLLPGMPVKIFAGNDKWVDAEFLGYQDEWAVVKRLQSPIPGRTSQVAARYHVALAERTIESAKTNAGQFKPSVRLLANTQSELTGDLEPVTAEIAILPSTPLRAANRNGGWSNVTSTSVPMNGKVRARLDGFPHHQNEYSLELLAIEKRVLEELQRPDAKEVFAKRMESLDAKWALERRKNAQIRDYLATYPLPDGVEPLSDKTHVKKGDPFRVYWGNRWHDVTAIAESKEGAVEINWDARSSEWNQFLSRKSLFTINDTGTKPDDKENAP